MILEPKKIKMVKVSIVSPSIFYEVMGPDAMILIFWMLCFKPAFPLSSFTFIKRLFSSSSLSAIRVVSSAHLGLLVFLPATLIPDCASFSPTFHMMYSAFKVNKQGDNIQPWRTPFTIWNRFVVPCPVLTVASWPVYSFLRRQVIPREHFMMFALWAQWRTGSTSSTLSKIQAIGIFFCLCHPHRKCKPILIPGREVLKLPQKLLLVFKTYEEAI